MDLVGRIFAAILVIIVCLNILVFLAKRVLTNEAQDALDLRSEEFLNLACASGGIRQDEYDRFLSDIAAIPFAPYRVEISAGAETVQYNDTIQAGEPDDSSFPSYAFTSKVRYTDELMNELGENGFIELKAGEWVRLEITGGRKGIINEQCHFRSVAQCSRNGPFDHSDRNGDHGNADSGGHQQ